MLNDSGLIFCCEWLFFWKSALIDSFPLTREKSKIFIIQRDNDKYFKQKLPTWRNGFCEIVRNVTIEKDPHDIYQDGEWGYITVYGRKIYVTRAGTEFAFEIRG